MTKQFTREGWLNAFIAESADRFSEVGAELPRSIRASIGFTSKGARSNRVGECWSETASNDGHFEIFIVPQTESAERIAGILTHELVHAAVGLEAGHGPAFRKIATALGLEGKMTATTEGDAWRTWASPIIEKLGPYPAAPMVSAVGQSSTPKKQTTRMIKVECPECGWHFRASRQNLDAIRDWTCMSCGAGQMMEAQ